VVVGQSRRMIRIGLSALDVGNTSIKAHSVGSVEHKTESSMGFTVLLWEKDIHG